MNLKNIVMALVLAFASVSVPSFACSGGGCHSSGGFSGGFVPSGRLVGAGAVANRRAFRLARRSRRAASFGLFGRANRLQNRSFAATDRANFRLNCGVFGRACRG